MRYLLLILFFVTACKPEKTKLTAQKIIDNSIQFSSLNKIENTLISFDFRKNSYSAKRSNGNFKLTKIVKMSRFCKKIR